MFVVEMRFCGDLGFFLPRDHRGETSIRRVLREKTGVKDVIEACGVPHVEVDLIVATDADSQPHAEDLDWQVDSPTTLEIYPVPAPSNALPEAPRLQNRFRERFVADGHLGKLARNLRLLGLDTAYERDADDRRLLAIMSGEQRALLTRDRRLLMHSVVRDGFCPRSSNSEVQTREVLRRFDLHRCPSALAPWSRCLRCNGILQTVPKRDVLDPLADEPLTLRFFNEFRRCVDCGQIYWRGTHFNKLSTRLARLLDR